jgi:flagellar biogenesis protein FliO
MRLALLFLLIPVAASAAPTDVSFELLDRGDAVEVIAHNVKASRTAVTAMRSRLEVPVVGRPSAASKVPTDATVKVIEFDLGSEPRVLSVKLGFERPDVKSLARFAQAIQVGDDLHLLFPRQVPAEGAIVKLPEPTLPAVVPTILRPVAVEPAKPVEPPKAVVTEPAKPLTSTVPLVAKAEPKPIVHAALTAAPDDESWTKLSTYGAIGLAIAGIGAWILKRRRTQQPAVSTIDVIAQRSLGGKAKIVWFSAGGRDMVVAVTPNQVRMLGQWKRTGEPAVRLPEATALPEPRSTPELRSIPARAPTASPAVSGILKLRERATTVQPTELKEIRINEDVATGDYEADELWARELLAAGGGRR